MTLIHKLNLNLNNNKFYIKRDDLLPFSFGGNKARKAINFFDDIKKNKCDVVVTYGSHSSNHCRVVANMAKCENLECIIISPEENYEETLNSKLVELFGAKIIKTPIDRVSETIESVLDELRKTKKPYFIQGGGHGNLGTAAYVEAYSEILEYEKENNTFFDYIFHASGTGTTQAGLVVGRILNNRKKQKIIGISIARNQLRGKNVILESINDYFGDSCDYAADVEFIDDYICGGYGKFNSEISNTIKEVLCCDGIPLNSTYTGKAFWGMKKYIEKNDIKDSNILFINTGGNPLFFDDLENLQK